MPSPSLPTFAAALVGAQSTSSALSLLQSTVGEVERGIDFILFRYDGRRGVLKEAFNPDAAEISFDLLPRGARKTISEGRELADLREGASDFLKLLGIRPKTEGSLLFLRGLSFDSDLCWTLAICAPRRLFGSAVSDKIQPYLQLFELAVGRVTEREARHEATMALETLMAKTHFEYTTTITNLRLELEQLRAAMREAGTPDPARVAQLESAAAKAVAEARGAKERLAAVEAQVASAVGQLEKAHLELYRQEELRRTTGSTLERVRQILVETGDVPALRTSLEELLASETAPR